MSEKLIRSEMTSLIANTALAGLIAHFLRTFEAAIRTYQATSIAIPEHFADFAYSDVLDTEADKMTDRITFTGFDDLRPNPLFFARTLVRLAYLDGGDKEVEQTINTLQRIGLGVVVAELPPRLLAVTKVSINRETSPPALTKIEINVAPEQRQREDTYLHELYHVVQYARDPKRFLSVKHPRFIASPLPVAVGVGGAIGLIKAGTTTRRQFALGVGHGLPSAAISYLVALLHEASAETDIAHQQLYSRLGLFSKHPFITSLRGKFFLSQP